MAAQEDPPPDVRELAERRHAARNARDFAAADALREELRAQGWLVRDAPEGFTLSPAPPFDVRASLRDLPDRTERPPTRRATVALLVDGWPEDTETCLRALVTHLPADAAVLALDLGDVDGAGRVLHGVATEHPGRVEAWHLAGPAGWADARNALLRADTGEVHVLAEISTLFDGDALTPVLAALAEDGVVGAGWRGVAVDDDWRGFHDVPPGDVEALLGYLFAVRRTDLLAAGGLPAKARFYRNADMELSFLLRDAGGAWGRDRLVVPAAPLPLHQGRHHGYHDTDPAYRDRESKRNYDRFLARFRGRDDLRIR